MFAQPRLHAAPRKKRLPTRFLLTGIVVGTLTTLFLVAGTLVVLPRHSTAANAGLPSTTAVALAVLDPTPAPPSTPPGPVAFLPHNWARAWAAVRTASALPYSVAPMSDVLPETTTVSAALGISGDGGTYNPPVVAQGGDCITGYIMDIYEQRNWFNGWKVTVTPNSPAGAAPLSDLADNMGTFGKPHGKFTGLGADTYTVECNVPAGWQPFTPAKFVVTLSGDPKAGCAEVRCKVEALPCLEVTKRDRNSTPPLLGIPGWTIEVTPTNKSSALAGVTDNKGKAYFYDLPPGWTTVAEVMQNGWRLSPLPGNTNPRTILLVSPATPRACTTTDFINEQIHDSCIKVCKKDPQGSPLENWSVTLTYKAGTRETQRKDTGADGCATFCGLALGEWLVNEKVSAGWQPVTSLPVTVNLTKPAVCPDDCEVVTIINKPPPPPPTPGCVEGDKINHLDQPLSDWEIHAQNAAGTVDLVAVTDANGHFLFPNLDFGTWEISEVLQDGWVAVTPPKVVVNVIQESPCEYVRFKNRTDYACVDVYKKDAHGNVGLPGWTITLTPAYGGASQTGTTDGTGWVRFNMLVPGTYIVAETPNVDWSPVEVTATSIAPPPAPWLPAPDNQSAKFTVEATGSCAVITFINRQVERDPVDPPSSSSDPPTAGSCRAYYTVQPGDNLSSIAGMYGITWPELQAVNQLSDPNLIYAGMVLCIPQ